MKPIRLGVFGAARITPFAVVRPARVVPEVELRAVAARDPARAAAFARRHRVPVVHASYGDLLADPEIDAVYVPLPNSHHARLTLAAVAAGKHVLCEKPFTANAAEAEAVVAAGRAAGVVVLEAFHWRYHPLAARMVELARSGVLGRVRHIETAMCIPLPVPGDIRYRLDLAGGATMDVGAYAIHMLRHLAGAEPRVVAARALLASPGVDRRMDAELAFDDGRSARIVCSLFSRRLLDIRAVVEGDRGSLRVMNPVAPQLPHRLRLEVDGRVTKERVRGEATYTCQLRAFAAAIRGGATPLTGGDDAVANMRVIDAVYRAAGLPLRQGVAPD